MKLKTFLRLAVALILGFTIISSILNYLDSGHFEAIVIRTLVVLGIIYLSKKIWE